MLRMLAATPKSPPSSLSSTLITDALQHTHCFCAMGEFGRQNQDHLQLASGNDARIGIEKDAAGVQVASKAGGLNLPLLGLDGDRHPRRNPRPGTAFALELRHEKWSLPQAHGRDDRFLGMTGVQKDCFRDWSEGTQVSIKKSDECLYAVRTPGADRRHDQGLFHGGHIAGPQFDFDFVPLVVGARDRVGLRQQFQ